MARPLPFFATAMPRSRTAWLAAWLTTDNTLCLHDSPANSFPPVAAGVRHGLSGPEVCTAFDDFTSCWPDAPWLVVDRADALASFEPVIRRHLDISGQALIDWWSQRQQLVEKVAAGPRTLRVDFGDLDYVNVAEKIWKHLMPDYPFSAGRWHMMNALNIQQEGARRYPHELTKQRRN